MNNPSLTPAQLSALLRFASAKLGISEQQLTATVQTGDTAHLGLSADQQQKLQGLLGQSPEALLQSEQIKQMLEGLLGNHSEG